MATEVFFHELSKDLLEPQIQISEQNVTCVAKQQQAIRETTPAELQTSNLAVVVRPLQISIDFRTRLTPAYKQLAQLQMASSALKHEVFQLHKRYIEMAKD